MIRDIKTSIAHCLDLPKGEGYTEVLGILEWEFVIRVCSWRIK